MKASIKFREDRKPLVRAKVPISVLGLPFLSGIAAGDGKELRLDLATAFEFGPSFRVSYCPNDSWNPFTLAIKTGIGAFGSPAAAPFSMTAEFNLLGRGVGTGGPTFSILFKPRFGDFTIKKSALSSSAPIPAAAVEENIHASNGQPPINGLENGVHSGKKANGFAADVGTSGVGGIGRMLSGVEVTARSVLPVGNRAAVRFRWGLKMPPELRSAISDGGGRYPVPGITLSKIPLLVMNKVSIEHVVDKAEPKESKTTLAHEAAETSSLVKRQLESMQAENNLLRRAVEDIRTEIGSWKASPAAVGGLASFGADVSRNGASPTTRKSDRRSNGKVPEKSTVKPGPEEVNEELKKAIKGAGI
ncbi:uncharacterized protein [Typha latifolia]|uniref:uncharacterized protein n=1 Tax=Typha latifolia TaxID=4733 RepID=UPI003C2F5314